MATADKQLGAANRQQIGNTELEPTVTELEQTPAKGLESSNGIVAGQLGENDSELEQLLKQAIERHPELEFYLRNPTAEVFYGLGVGLTINSAKTNRSSFTKRGEP